MELETSRVSLWYKQKKISLHFADGPGWPLVVAGRWHLYYCSAAKERSSVPGRSQQHDCWPPEGEKEIRDGEIKRMQREWRVGPWAS